ncbi:hypothetical protein [Bradyrhizobium sp. th.b2]|uniref:hypothetical protein n=1 Tax=Bradyrhizobium sp. th-b2 TaxID=172088 RepID=UPI000404F3AB|nr:hypothetical protein [Bradyrhizobium sp. th.b2]
MNKRALTSVSTVALAWLLLVNASSNADADIFSETIGHIAKELEKGVHNIGDTGEKALHDVGNTGEKALHDVGDTGEKALHDTGKTIEKAVQDTGKAGETVYKFGVREIEGIGQMVSDADRRLKEGKIVDAVWHFATDPVKHTEENAAKAAQESELVRVAGQIAASAYGGPGGAAAYAAWLTYKQTNDVGLALRVGAITGAAAYGTGSIGKIPNANAGVIAEKTIMAGAIGGVAVAAAGGDQQAIQEGFLKMGGAVLVQSVYEVQTEHKLDARVSKGDAYCMAAVDPSAPCAPPVEAYKEIGPDGKAVVDKDGLPKVDVRMTEPRSPVPEPMRPHVGTWAKPGEAPIIGTQETSTFMVTVSKYPGMNAMAMLHDHLSYSMKLDPVTNVWTIVPAAAVTYYGTEAPAQDAIRKAATDNSQPIH